MPRSIVLMAISVIGLVAAGLLFAGQSAAAAVLLLADLAFALAFELHEHGLPRRTPASTGLSPVARVVQVLDLNTEIAGLAKQVHSDRLHQALEQGCEWVPQIMRYTQQKDPDNLATTAARIGVYLQSVHTALQQYVTMQNNPGPDTPARLYNDGKVLEGFPEFIRTSREQLEAGDLAAYRANLHLLQPMTTKGITGNI